MKNARMFLNQLGSLLYNVQANRVHAFISAAEAIFTELHTGWHSGELACEVLSRNDRPSPAQDEPTHCMYCGKPSPSHEHILSCRDKADAGIN